MDWWALGILIYEMLIGVTPFYNKERRLLLLKIRTSKVVFPDKRKYKIDYSDDFVDIVMSLLNKEKKDRLGSKRDFQEILDHPWFSDLDITAVLEQTMKPPLQIEFNAGDGKFDTRFFNSKATPQDLAETVLPSDKQKKLKDNAKQFDNFESNKRI